jgi:hypothetical protein
MVRSPLLGFIIWGGNVIMAFTKRYWQLLTWHSRTTFSTLNNLGVKIEELLAMGLLLLLKSLSVHQPSIIDRAFSSSTNGTHLFPRRLSCNYSVILSNSFPRTLETSTTAPPIQRHRLQFPLMVGCIVSQSSLK